MGPRQARAWYVISLRPQGGHAGLRHAAAKAGAGVLALSPWTLTPRADAPTRDALRAALQAPAVVFTSPAAVHFAHALLPLRAGAGQAWIGTGAGTRQALRRAGIDGALAPARMDSEGLLELEALQASPVGLVTAPGGRGVLAGALAARGTQVLRADVYARTPIPLSPQAVNKLRALDQPTFLALSSGEALGQVLDRLPSDAAAALRGATAIAASARLADLAGQAGFRTVVQAEGPRPGQLVEAAHAVFSRRFR